MSSRKYKTNDVFGVRSKLIASYIERQDVDLSFKEALTDGNEVIVYGSSKQGKTSLILKNLREDQYVRVECSPQTKSIDIYKSILRQLGITFVESETKEKSRESTEAIGTSIRVQIPAIADAQASPSTANKSSSKTSTKEASIDFNLALAQDVAEVLLRYNSKKYLVLENFHYLALEVQEALAFDLRVFQDHGIIFIILGIWREANRLTQFNGDLLDRITEIPVEPWDKDDFRRAIKKGADLLNVDFSQIQDELISGSFDSIGVVQELCKNCCLDAGVGETQFLKKKITKDHLKNAIEKKTKDYGMRHIRNFESFADISKKTSSQSGKPSLAFPYYLIKLLLTTDFDSIERGLSRATLLEKIREMHHRQDDVRSGDLGGFLHNITQHQVNRKIQPPFVDYDRGGKSMRIIDSSLYFFLRHCNREEILLDLPDPFNSIDDAQYTLELESPE